MLESVLKDWTDIASESSVFFPSLVFNKKTLEKLAVERKEKRHNLMKKFDLLFSDHPVQNKDRKFQAEPNIPIQLDAPIVSMNTDVTDLEHVVHEEDSGNSRNPLFHRNPRDAKAPECIVTALEAVSDDLSHSVFSEEYCELKTKEAKQKHNVMSSDLASTRDSIEFRHITSIEAADQPFSLKTNGGGKHRRQWIEPNEVIILHGEPDEDLSCDISVEENSSFLENMPDECDYELEAGTFCNMLAQGENYELSISEFAACFPYTFPSLTETKLQSRMEYAYRVSSPSLQTMTSFSNVYLEEFGPEIFARPCMHKLAQHYKSVNLPQSDGYKKTVASFDAVSQKLWNFEDCICDGDSNTKMLPSLLFTRASCAVETLSLENRSAYMPRAKAWSEEGKAETNSQHASCRMQSLSNVSRATAPCNLTLKKSMATPLIELSTETALEMLKEEKSLEVLYKNPQNGECTVCSGGATWQSYLGLRCCEATETVSTFETDQESSEVPLEVIVEKCIIQEVLSQYQCISHLTVVLLQKVFGLQDHLATLRRYFFMERGDWADIFTFALYRNIWHPTGHLQRQLELQMLLEAAVQNSSCQEDEYAERLHVIVGREGEGFQSDKHEVGLGYSNKTSLCAFNFINLGYRLEWPVSLIITSASLKLYNATFHFLICVKLAAHAVSNIWKFLKDLLCDRRKHGTLKKQDDICSLILFRQQMDHFVTTLQGHLETQLLHNVWQKFLQAVLHEGKDLLDLERIHGLYLHDALHVCFLSEETKSVKALIDNIMQCLLDLSTCLNLFGKQEDGKATLDRDKVQSVILEAKNSFDSSMQELLQIALNWQNHSALSPFWTRLDFNGFFGSLRSKYS